MPATRKSTKLAVLPRAAVPEVFGTRIGRLVAWVPDRGPVVDYPGNAAGPLLARSLLSFEDERVRAALEGDAEVLLAFDADDGHKPILLGILAAAGAATERAVAEEPLLEAKLDGRRVVLTAHDEIVLQCGQASITLRRNGRVVIRGTYVETQAAGVNRIKGGAVKIN